MGAIVEHVEATYDRIEAGDRPEVWIHLVARADASRAAADVEVGQTVAAGDPLVALEAMKTEIVVSAPRAGKVHDVLTATGRQVEPGSPLVVIV